ncbi:MAG: cytochrome c biogenesis protein CcdA [Patescibacteria group bacterium]
MPEGLTWGIVTTAALADSINPCVIGALVFLLAFMTRVFKTRTMMIVGGLLYTSVVYLTYLGIGFGILKVTGAVAVASMFTLLAAVIAILAGFLEIKDYFWYGKGFSLQMIPGGAERLKQYVSQIEKMEKRHPAFLLLSIALLGVFVVIIELPCTGAPYLAILALIQSEATFAQAVPLLLFYNLVFILPLLVIVGLTLFGVSSDQLEAWRKRHRGFMRLGVGLFLIGLGIYLLNSLYGPFF